MILKEINTFNKIFLCIISLLILSCTTRLNIKIKEKIEKSSVQLEHVQFYNSERIVLRRRFRLAPRRPENGRKEEQVDEASGKVKFRKGKFIEKLIIRKNTPGVFIKEEEGKFFVSFEKGESKYFAFKEFHGNYLLDYKNTGGKCTIEYDGKTYKVIKGFEAYLMLKKKSRFVMDKKRRYIKGRKID